jgi:prepilin-type N-terminal cleavage/methylation domain-containing protein
MKSFCRVSSVECRAPDQSACSRPSTFDLRRVGRAFTLVEIMVVVGIMGVIMAMGVPSLFRALQKEGMRKAVSDVVEACSNARARAILSGETAQVVFYPKDRRFEFGGAGPAPSQQAQSAGVAGRLPRDIDVEMLDINLLEYGESDVARVRFFPNGTSDEMTLILRSRKNERRAISLEFSTGLASVEADPLKFGKW